MKFTKAKIAALAVVPALVLGLGLAACSSGSSGPGGGAPPSASTLALTCTVGFDSAGTGWLATPPAGSEIDAVQVTADNTGSAPVAVSAVNAGLIAGGNLLTTLSVPLGVQAIGAGNTITVDWAFSGSYHPTSCSAEYGG
jgi:hypothetical protein